MRCGLGEDGFRGLAHRDPSLARPTLEGEVGLFLAHPVLYQLAFGPVHEFARFQAFLKFGFLPRQGLGLFKAGDSDWDGSRQVALVHWLDQVALNGQLRRAFDQVLLTVGGQDQDRHGILLGDGPGGLQPVAEWHLDVEQGQVGSRAAHDVQGLAPIAGEQHLVTQRRQHGLQPQPDDGLVVGDENFQRLPHSPSCSPGMRTMTCVPCAVLWKSSLPRRSSRTSVSTISNPKLDGLPEGRPTPSSATSIRYSFGPRPNVMRTRPEARPTKACSSAFCSRSLMMRASEVAGRDARVMGAPSTLI